MILEQIHLRGVRTSAVYRWLGSARQELEARRQERCAPPPQGAPRTYHQRWKAMQACAEREHKSLKQALDLVEAFCRDGRRDRLGRALLLHNAARQAFGDYCKKRMAIVVDPTYFAA
jgi:hypothetical protein